MRDGVLRKGAERAEGEAARRTNEAAAVGWRAVRRPSALPVPQQFMRVHRRVARAPIDNQAVRAFLVVCARDRPPGGGARAPPPAPRPGGGAHREDCHSIYNSRN